MKALVSCQIAFEFAEKTGIEAIPLKPYKRLDTPVATHADMLFCVLDKTVFCYEDYVIDNGFESIIRAEGYDLVFVSNKCAPEYPNDISLNVLVMGKLLFCYVKHTAKEILEYAKKSGYEVINVKQGYSACSTLVIDENIAITSDKCIASAIEGAGKEVLFVSNEEIILPGYNCGFIGGATGKMGGSVCFFGDVSALKDGERIVELLSRKKQCIISISSGRVYDFGGIKLL